LHIPSIKITRSFFIVFLITLVTAFFVSSPEAHSEEGITWNCIRLLPGLSIMEKYSDNIFLSNKKRQNDAVTIISPQLSLDFSISPDNYVNVSYDGYYSLYRKADNFKKDIHKTDASWKWITPKGSILKIGAAMNFDSIQPYSLQDDHKDFVEMRLFGETAFEAGAFIDMGIAYDRTVQRFKKSLYNTDDFDRDTVTLRFAYKRLPDTTIVSEYSYFYQNNKDRSGPFKDLDAHVVLLGAQWDSSKKLHGHIKAGYYVVNSTSDTRSSGFAMDTDIGYRLTDVIVLNLVAYRRAVTSTRTARESGEYYISTGGGLKFSYSGLQALMLSANAQYKNNQFTQSSSEPGPTRKDDYFDLGVSATYDIQKWYSFITNYHYRVNNSSVDEETFTENRIEAQFRFAF
jgi:hypothetical protein